MERNWFGVAAGVFFGLALLKFGNAVIMEREITWPKDGYEWALFQWPVAVGYGLLVVLAIFGAATARWRVGAQRWLMAMPLAWFVWQVLAATSTVDATLTVLTLKHFAACVVCFYLGYFALSRAESLGVFWAIIAGALLLVVLVGFDQRFRGLAETREFLLKNEQSHWRDVPPEQLADLERSGLLVRTPEGYAANPGLLRKAESNRISSTLFYPNSLAGALLLVVPGVLVALVQSRRFTAGAKVLLGVLLGGGAAACLYWSGSKAGWLLALVLGVVALLRAPLSRQTRTAIVAVLIVGGVVGFTVKYAGFFQRGATSVVARFDYWQAALKTAAAEPMFGTGPGTFSRPYQQIKKPESEMARLTHNDYLQQASDSGWPGFILYTAMVVGVLTVSGRKVLAGADLDWGAFAIWLGVLGWALQGLVEFGLYTPALAWTAFGLLGWLLATADAPSAKRTAMANARGG